MIAGPDGPLGVDLIIWDLDGTLADTAEDITDSLNRTLASQGIAPRSLEEVKIFIGGGIHNLVAKAMGSVDPDTDVVTEIIGAFREDYTRNLLTKTRLYPGVREVVEHFRDKSQVVISNKLKEMTQAIVSGLGLGAHLAEVIGQGGDYPIKPDPAAARAMIAAHGRSPKRTVFVGDSLTDLKTARNADCLAVLVTYGMRPREEILSLDADAHVDEIKELMNLIH